jgi:hypothetical protein
MWCHDTGSMEAIPKDAIHIDKEVIELAQAIVPYVHTIQEVSEGNGDIILPFRGGALETIKLDLQSKLRKLIRFPRRKS